MDKRSKTLGHDESAEDEAADPEDPEDPLEDPDSPPAISSEMVALRWDAMQDNIQVINQEPDSSNNGGGPSDDQDGNSVMSTPSISVGSVVVAEERSSQLSQIQRRQKSILKKSCEKWKSAVRNKNKKTLSAYAVVEDPRHEKDEWQIDTQDEFDFLEKGREFQSRKQKHHFTTQEKQMMATYESSALRPSHTAVYRHWLSKLPPISETESWIVICVIGVTVGILAFGMKLITERLQIFSNPFIEDFVDRGRTFRLWMYFSLMSCAFGACSAIVVTYFCPQAGGSGVPEISGILNGCVVRNMLGLKTLICKIVSCVFTVLSGLPVGIEGPMIHIGGMIGALMARPFLCPSCQDYTYTVPPTPSKRWKKCKRSFRKLCRYRDCQERHNLICMGSAAGVAAAFSSPITGLTFAMEEMSTHWTNILTWQTFVSCILARSTTELLHTIVATVEADESQRKREDGSNNLDPHASDFDTVRSFQISDSALFDIRVKLEFSMSIIIPTVMMGVLGGFLGSLYIFTQLKMAKVRRQILRSITRIEFLNAVKVIEVVLVSFICATLTMLAMSEFPCGPVNHTETLPLRASNRHMKLKNFACTRPLTVTFEPDYENQQSIIQYAGEFHEGATLMFESWEQLVRNLFSRRTADLFSVYSLFLVFVFFFVFSSWTALTSIASGILIPQLAIGALYGRLLGKSMYDLFRTKMKEGEQPITWDFTDPGAMALLGAASFFAGSSRLPITSVVMMTEMTNDINISLFVMIVVMLSKFVGDLFTHSIVHSLLEFKCIPILDPELKIYHRGKRIDLELFAVSQVMAYPVVTANLTSSVYDLANMLLETNHGAFPVVRRLKGKKGHIFMGNITRLELTILLTKTESFDINELKREDIEKIRISYPEAIITYLVIINLWVRVIMLLSTIFVFRLQYSSNKLKDVVITNKILEIYSSDFRYSKVFVNLYPYINLSTYTVSFRFSLHRTYSLFRELGLRHLVVVDDYNEVRGIVTRKDLLGDVVEEKIKSLLVRNKNMSTHKPSDSKEGNNKPDDLQKNHTSTLFPDTQNVIQNNGSKHVNLVASESKLHNNK